jgi:hypothetical protein
MVHSTTTIARRRSLFQIALVVLGFPGLLAAQVGHDHGKHPPAAKPAPTVVPDGKGDVVAAGVDASMSGPLVVSPYMTLTPTRAATATDSARAAKVASELRDAIAKYKDVRVAEADGYKLFAPRLPQKVYHFTNTWRSMKEAFRFDPAQPSSLLYERTPGGEFELVGAMYHAPKRLSPEKLDERVPLSMARWHAHTNFCVPLRGDQQRWRESRDGKPVFGPLGGISTREQCDAVGGRFHEQVFGWMVHAMVFAGDDPGSIWGGGHGGHGDHR